MKVTKTKRKNGRVRLQMSTTKPSMTEQQHKDAVNINTIVAKARKTGMAPIQSGSPLYGDFSQVESFQDAQDMINAARDQFINQIPAEVREMFGNNPAAMMEFLANEENEAQAIEMGLVKPKAVKEPDLKETVKAAVKEAQSESQSPSKGNESNA